MSRIRLPGWAETLPAAGTIGGAPEGHDARVLAALATRSAAGRRDVIMLARDEARLAALADLIGFFAPRLELVVLPPWDCLPYDRVSPKADVIAERIDALCRLLQPAPPEGRLVLTTLGAAAQRLMPPAALQGGFLEIKPKTRLDRSGLLAYLARNGYGRAQTVREPGEYAVRGDIIDLFAPGRPDPVRIDLFGDEIERIRRFDPLSQRTIGEIGAFALKPMSEATLDPDSIARFRSAYRTMFGAVTGNDPLYESISEGRRHPGMEHWLPLFYDGLVTLFDWLPNAAVVLEPQAEAALTARHEQVTEFHDNRLAKARAGAGYKPVPVDLLYLSPAGFAAAVAAHARIELSPFAAGEGGADASGRRGADFLGPRSAGGGALFDALKARIAEHQAAGRRVLIAAYSSGARDRLLTVLAEHGVDRLKSVANWHEAAAAHPTVVPVVVLALENGFVAPDLAVLTEQDILGDRIARAQGKKKKAADRFLQEMAALSAGDLVVHRDHGVGRYEGLLTIEAGGAPHDCLKVVYEGGDKLYIPVENIEVLSRYGSEDAGAVLDRLGSSAWQARSARVKRRLKDMAEALLKIAAARAVQKAEPVSPPPGLYEEFAARFSFTETEDQDTAIHDTLADLSSGRPMDRLVCGDVGFGKTEVALRAAFMVALSGQQVAVVVPTTLLARQHFMNFTRRFAGLPVRLGCLSRLQTPKEATQVKEGLKAGTIDIVVGTHAILGAGVKFARLGLVIVDEEQHFGVKQKEKLKSLCANVHVLTLTATPIPRTLQLALTGVRELSLIATPPVDRLAVRSSVGPFDPVVLRDALMREHYRGGQSFVVCPRIEDLEPMQQTLAELVPEIKLATAHGRMGSAELEEVMTAFDDKQYGILLATNIIESGLDLPNANTIVIHRADLFGLAQLYQLRGRVGRGKQRAYAYLTYDGSKTLTRTAQERLHVMETLDSLGAGFTLASHDLDIRGAGNLLGEEQSGHIREVGIELYQQMLEEAVAAAKGEAVAADSWSPTINLGTPVLIPETYIGELNVRMSLYRRLSDLNDPAELEAFAAEMIDRFGPIPDEVENLLDVMAIKARCRRAGIERIDAGPKGAVITFHASAAAHADRLVAWIGRQGATAKLRPDQKLVVMRMWEQDPIRVKGARKLVEELAALAEGAAPQKKAG